MTGRKVVQISTAFGNGNEGYHPVRLITALCDDGAIFTIDDHSTAWVAIPPVPQDEQPASGELGAEAIELAAREKCREFITGMADEYMREHFSYDSSTNAWETRNAAVESYEEGLRDAAHAIAKLNCEKFGHDWRQRNDITRQCKRCEVQEHGEHLRALLAGDTQ